MKENKALIGYLLAGVTFFFFSVHGVGIRFLSTSGGMDAGLITFIRYFGGTLFLLLFLPFFVKKMDYMKVFTKETSILRDKMFWLTGGFLFMTLLSFHAGLQYTSASNSVLIQTLFPVVVAIIVLFTHGKGYLNLKIRNVFFVILLASIGSSMLISDSSFILPESSAKTKILGDAFAFLSMVFLAMFNFLNVELRRKYQEYNGLLITILFLSFGLILSLPFSMIYFSEMILIFSDPKIFTISLIISAGSTGLAYLSLFLAARYLNVITIALLYNMIGVTTIIFEYYFYGGDSHPFTWKLFFGALIIITSAVYINYKNTGEKEKVSSS